MKNKGEEMGKYITTYTKVHFSVLEPTLENIIIEDIAHALSMMTRANGHFPVFYSVAQHSMDCYNEAITRNYGERVALACLLHDASEAYMADISRPVKKDMTMYLQIEEQLQGAIFKKFLQEPLSEQEMELVSNIDDACLYYEFLHFMDEKLFPTEPVLVSSPEFKERPMKDVEQQFLTLAKKGGIV